MICSVKIQNFNFFNLISTFLLSSDYQWAADNFFFNENYRLTDSIMFFTHFQFMMESFFVKHTFAKHIDIFLKNISGKKSAATSKTYE